MTPRAVAISPATRPVLNNAPAAIGFATTFTDTGTPGMQNCSFIKMSSITHSVNTDLRYLSLPFTETSPGTYRITAHSSLNVMTPGYWMLFGLNAAGAHSVSKTLLVDAINSVGVAVPGNQAAYINQPASLQMIASGPAGSVFQWSATGLPAGLSIHPFSGLISGTPAALGTSNVRVTVTDGNTSAFADFTWAVQPVTYNQNYANFTGAGGLTFNGNAALSGSVLRVAANAGNQAGSAFLSSPVTIGPDTSLSSRFVFRVHGSADGADGMTFMIQGVGPNALGAAGSGLGYGGIGASVAVEIDNYQGAGDTSANHVAIISGGDVATHISSFVPGWDLENEASHTVWVEYDGPVNQLRVYAAQGIVNQRPANPSITATLDLPTIVGTQAWLGFSGGTGGLFNNHDVEAWSVSLNAFALPTPPVLGALSNETTVLGAAVSKQLSATDANGDLLTWSAGGLPPGLALDPATGLITGSPSAAGVFNPVVTVTDGNTSPVNGSFTWTVDGVLTVQPISGTPVPAGTSVALIAQASGGLNPQYNWSFGDGTPDTGFTASPSTAHVFANPGRHLVTVTVRDATDREVTASYRQAVYAPLTPARPTASSSIAYEDRVSGNDRLWVVNPDNDSTSVFDAVTHARLAEINVGRAPRTLALDAGGRAWVANAGSATITVLQSDFSIARTINLPRGSRPYGIVFDPAGANAFVALEDGGKVLKLNPASGAVVGEVVVGLHVRHLSVTADGAQVLATRFVTPRLPGEDTAVVQTSVAGVDYGGEVLVLDAAGMNLLGTTILKHSEEPDTSNSAKGIPNYLGAAAISPDGTAAWVPSKQDNIKRGGLRNGGALTHDMAVRSIASRIALPGRTEVLDDRIDFDNAGIASATAFDPNGNLFFTALEGSREVVVADAWAKVEVLRFEAGRAPQALALSPDGRTIYVHNFMDRTVTVHDLTALANGAETAPPAPVVLNCVTTEKLLPQVLLGKQFFYDTRDTRVAFQQYISCAGCHNDGGQDGRVWDFTQFGEGLRNTITLRGHGGTAQGPLHWTGNFDEVQDFEGQIRGFALGTGLMSDTDFHAGTRSQTLGDAKAGVSADLDALAAYVASLTTNGDSPHRAADGSMTLQGRAGQAVFNERNCMQCHSGAQFTDSALNVFRNIGTIKSSSGQRLGGPLPGFDTPTLLGLWNAAPYLHDGSAATLSEAVSAHNGVNLTPQQMSDLVAFLNQLDDAGIAPEPSIINWTAPTAISYGTPLGETQLNATASVPGTFSYSPASGTVLNAGNAQLLSVTFTPDDPLSYAPANATVTIDVLRAALTVNVLDATMVYGAALPAFGATYGGFVNGDTVASLDALATFSTTATSASSVGSYSINASGAADGNYTFGYVSGLLSVTRANLTITADNKVKAYGASNPALTASYAGFVNGDTAASLDTPAVLSTSATPGSGVGTYPITVAGAADANYAIAFDPGTLTVNPAALTIRADDKSKVAGTANPVLTATYSGLVNGDTAASLDSPVVLTTTADAGSPAGTYPITAGGAADVNYLITHLNGTLTVQPDTALPAPWQHQDVGAVGLAGDATHLDGAFTVSGSGTDIWNNADGFHFTYRDWSGNAEIVARVTSVGNTDPWAKAGVMFRESLTAGSRHVMMVITPGNGSAFQRRVATDGVSTHTAGPVVTAPYWVKLLRTGDSFDGYISSDGVTWTLVGSQAATLPAGGYVGLAVTAHNNALISTATFTDVSVQTPVVPPSITLTTPVNGASYTAPASINLSAGVLANGNAITAVEFLNGATVIGTDTTEPYTFNWSNVDAGSYTLGARVVYAAGSVNAVTVGITVDPAPTPPAAPANLTATAVSSSQINLSWTAGSANHTGFKIERSLDGSAYTQIGTTAANVTTFNSTGLNASTLYHHRVRANNAQGDSPYSNVASATTPAAATVIRVNFQPSGATVPAGYLADTGAVYGNRGNGQTYGWNSANTAHTRDRNSTRSADQRYDTLNHMQKSGGGRTWEIAVPNGTYTVFVVAGDAGHIDSVYRINVEGQLIVSGTPTSANRWVSGTQTLTVSDGRLTVSNGTGASNNKICFIDITPAGGGATAAIVTPAVEPDAPPALNWIARTAAGQVTLQVLGFEGSTYEVEVSSDLMTWEVLGMATSQDSLLTVDDPNPDRQPQRYYRARLVSGPPVDPATP